MEAGNAPCLGYLPECQGFLSFPFSPWLPGRSNLVPDEKNQDVQMGQKLPEGMGVGRDSLRPSPFHPLLLCLASLRTVA